MDLLESGGEGEPRPIFPRVRAALAARPPGWVVAAVTGAVLATTGGGVVAAASASARAADEARLEVDVLPVGSSSYTIAGVASGELTLLLVNRRAGRVRLGELRLAVPGLRVLQVESDAERPLGPYEEREVTLTFLVQDCGRLVLPGTLTLSLTAQGQAVRRDVPV
jgi:hypothetical protein